jgi:hypothetical protein
MTFIPVKTGNKKQDKIFGNINRAMGGMQQKIRIINGSVKTSDVGEGELVLSVVSKDSESPGAPISDEGRVYFKGNGVLYQMTGTKVGG